MKARVMAKTLFTFLFASAVLFSGCNKKKEYSPITAWDQYNDEFFGLRFAHPKGWHLNVEGGRITLTSTLAAAEKFVDPRMDDKGEDGVQITIFHERPDSLQPLDDVVNAYISDRKNEGFVIKDTVIFMLDSTDARKFTYYGNYTQTTKLSTTRVYTIRDSVQYYLEYTAFNDLFEPYRYVMDTLINSIRLPRPKVKAPNLDESLPSTTFTEFSNNFLKISYPDNFTTSFPAAKGEMKFSLELKGYRQDCTVRIDVLPAKGVAVEKVFEQNQGKFPRASKGGEVNIAGVKALFLNYSPAKDVGSRAYFLVKNDQVYRIIMNYYAPKRADFLPAFEKTVSSIRIS